MEKELLVLIDGNNLVHRGFHAFNRTGRLLTVRKTGEIVSAVYVFASMLLKVINDLKPTQMAVAFDRAAPTFRHLAFAEYKSQRPETPSELRHQLGRARELVGAFNIPIFELDGYEADDLLGTLAKEASARGTPVVIVTGDADAMQLVSDSENVKLLYLSTISASSEATMFDEDGVKAKYGITPKQVADFKALKGDESDNIPGLPGIGPDTACKLINAFGGIDGIYAHIDEVKALKLRGASKVMDTLKQNEARARENLKLATIVTDAPVTCDVEKCRLTHYDRDKVVNLFRELEFFTLIERLPGAEESKEARPAAKVDTGNYHLVTSEEDLKGLVSRLKEAKTFSFDTETDNLDVMKANIVGISVSTKPCEAYYIPVGHQNPGENSQIPMDKVVASLKPLMEDEKISKVAHNGKYDMTVLAESGLHVRGLAFDTMVAAHLLGEKNLSLKSLALSLLGLEMTPISDLIGEGKKQIPMSEVQLSRVAEYCSADSDVTYRIAETLKPELEKEGLFRLFSDVEMPLVPILMEMERNGVLLDTKALGEMSKEFEAELKALKEEIYKSCGHEFNINSPQQLGIVLFEEMKLPSAKKTKTGFSTDAGVLEDLREHRVVNLILEYRNFSKLKSTYVDALPTLVNPKTGRVHTSFNQTKTTTGRLSSSEPNVQNIPVRGERGREIRKAFVAPPGSYLLAGDYSQIDLRSLAHLSSDPSLIQAFREGRDAHALTASYLYHVPTEQVTGDMRRLAKTVNFGVIYGMSEYGLEQATELSREEARHFIADYFTRYPGVKQYLEDTKKQAREKGYVQTILNRRRYIPEIHASNRQVREAAERMAINMPVQGTSADIIKIAMINLSREMKRRELKSKMLLQVHDELIFEVPEGELGIMKKIVPEIMSTACMLTVPLKVEIKVGHNWGEME